MYSSSWTIIILYNLNSLIILKCYFALLRLIICTFYLTATWKCHRYDPSDGSRGGALGGWHPLFLDQTEAQSAEKNFLRPPPPYSHGLDDPPWSDSLYPAIGPGYQIDMFMCLHVDVISMMPCLFSVCVIQAHSRQRAWTRCQHRNGAKWWQPNVSPSCRIFGKKMWKIGQMVRAWIVYTVLHVKSRLYLLLLFQLRLRCYFCLYVF